MAEHVPNPKPLEDWTEEDFLKFRMFSSHCPMCKYKLEYAITMKMIQSMQSTSDEVTKASLATMIGVKQGQLLELGLFIASSVDEATKQTGLSPNHN